MYNRCSILQIVCLKARQCNSFGGRNKDTAKVGPFHPLTVYYDLHSISIVTLGIERRWQFLWKAVLFFFRRLKGGEFADIALELCKHKVYVNREDSLY